MRSAADVVGRLCQTPIRQASVKDALRARRRRCVREEVSVKEKWLNPGGSERRDCREPNLELRRTDKRRLTRMLAIA